MPSAPASWKTSPAIDEEAITGLKFSEGLPVALVTEMIQQPDVGPRSPQTDCLESLLLQLER